MIPILSSLSTFCAQICSGPPHTTSLNPNLPLPCCGSYFQIISKMLLWFLFSATTLLRGLVISNLETDKTPTLVFCLQPLSKQVHTTPCIEVYCQSRAPSSHFLVKHLGDVSRTTEQCE